MVSPAPQVTEAEEFARLSAELAALRADLEQKRSETQKLLAAQAAKAEMCAAFDARIEQEVIKMAEIKEQLSEAKKDIARSSADLPAQIAELRRIQTQLDLSPNMSIADKQKVEQLVSDTWKHIEAQRERARAYPEIYARQEELIDQEVNAAMRMDRAQLAAELGEAKKTTPTGGALYPKPY